MVNYPSYLTVQQPHKSQPWLLIQSLSTIVVIMPMCIVAVIALQRMRRCALNKQRNRTTLHWRSAQQRNYLVRGATEALNLIAQTYARANLTAGDEILVSELEHHANIVPWQMIAAETGARVIKIPMRDDCTLDLDRFYSLLSDKTKIVAVAHIATLRTRNPIEKSFKQLTSTMPLL